MTQPMTAERLVELTSLGNAKCQRSDTGEPGDFPALMDEGRPFEFMVPNYMLAELASEVSRLTAENERLRAELSNVIEKQKETTASWKEDIDRLAAAAATIERLRALLVRFARDEHVISSWRHGEWDDSPDAPPYGGTVEMWGFRDAADVMHEFTTPEAAVDALVAASELEGKSDG